MEFVEWEDEVTNKVQEKLECTRGDAQGVVEGQSFEMAVAWGKALSPEETANVIVNKATV